MSMETWKAEFMPCEANTVKSGDAAEHSLRKWIGLRKENRERHQLQIDDNCEVLLQPGDCSLEWLSLGQESCALCVNFYGVGGNKKGVDLRNGCIACPIHKMTGRDCLDEYDRFSVYCDTEPMIRLLERTVAFQNAGGLSIKDEILRDANAFYGDNVIKEFIDNGLEPRSVGDTLAEFIAFEIYDVVTGHSEINEARQEVNNALLTAVKQLQRVADGILNSNREMSDPDDED